jgi:VIT1/CCC1 family predicted Fe2+/Mn2+ transporter
MSTHGEAHRTTRIGWMRAAVLGANDGLISTSSIIVGVASSALVTSHEVLLAGLAGGVAGALSMAAGEYVSVSSQSDTETADLARERRELKEDPIGEHAELRGIYVQRGLTMELAEQVATELEQHDALAAHARDELGITEITRARPLQAAIASAMAFFVGAGLPVMIAAMAPLDAINRLVPATTLVLLGALGSIAGHLGGASLTTGAVRVMFWGSVAMGITALVGHLFGVAVG